MPFAENLVAEIASGCAAHAPAVDPAVCRDAFTAVLDGLGPESDAERLLSASPAGLTLLVHRRPGHPPEVLKLSWPGSGEEPDPTVAVVHPRLVPVLASGCRATPAGAVAWSVQPFYPGALTLREALVRRIEGGATRTALPLWLGACCGDVARALAALHAAGIVHLDVKPDNILVLPESGTALLADTAFARRRDLAGECRVGLTPYYAHPELRLKFRAAGSHGRESLTLPRARLEARCDIYALGRSLLELLGLLDARFPETLHYDYAFSWLHLSACRMLDGRNQSAPDSDLPETWNGLGPELLGAISYRDCAAIAEDCAKLPGERNYLETIPELHPFAGRRIMIAPGMPAALTDRVRRTIGHPVFSRLASVPQIDLLASIFPTATHTRYEHSLGAYRNAILYIQSLWNDAHNPLFRQLVSERDLVTLLLGVLLHDIGQYPFGHTIEELGSGLRHEILSELFLENPTPDSDGMTLRQIIEDPETGWGIPLADLKRFLAVAGERDEDGPDFFSGHNPTGAMLHSILDGPIDVDKLDYLVRDSRMCFLHYGDAIDIDRLIANLTIVVSRDGEGREQLLLGAYERGGPAAETLSFVRYLLYQTLYWHHASRAGRAMFKTAVAPLADRTPTRSGRTKNRSHFIVEIGRLLGVDDVPRALTLPDMLEHFGKKADETGRELIRLIRERRYYKRLLTIDEGPDAAIGLDDFRKAAAESGFGERLRARLLVRFEKALTDRQGPGASLLTPERGEKTLELLARPLAILVDAPRPSIGTQDKLRLVAEPKRLWRNRADRHARGERVSAVWHDVHARLMSIAAKGRVFCHPDIRDALMAALGPGGISECVRETINEQTPRRR